MSGAEVGKGAEDARGDALRAGAEDARGDALRAGAEGERGNAPRAGTDGARAASPADAEGARDASSRPAGGGTEDARATRSSPARPPLPDRAADALLAGGTGRAALLVGALACAAGLAAGVLCAAATRAATGYPRASLGVGALAGTLCAAGVALVGALFLAADARRRRWLADLASRVDRALRDPLAPQRFASYGEGELAVLENELQKLCVRLRDQASRLRLERDSLADSLADVSHQLRTPLSAITLTLELLGRPSADEVRRRELVRGLRAQVDHLGWLASALLVLARSDAGALRVCREEVRVADLVRDAVEPLRIALELRGQTFEAHLGRGDEAYLGDPGWSREALANVLKNCMEHTPPGGHVRLEARRDALACRIVVTDDGPGISCEDLPHVFERFYKGKGSAPESAGVGLALARCLVNAQGGTLSAGNGPRGGARFEFTFPHVAA